MGCTFFGIELFAQEKMIESMTPDQQEWARSFPGWIHFLNGLAVFTGAGRSVGLVMRKGWSVLLLVISLVAVIVHMFCTMIVAGGLEVMGPCRRRHRRAWRLLAKAKTLGSRRQQTLRFT